MPSLFLFSRLSILLVRCCRGLCFRVSLKAFVDFLFLPLNFYLDVAVGSFLLEFL